MAQRLFVVKIAVEIVVLADDEASAKKIAVEARRDISEFDHRASEMTHLPGDWDLDAQPFGDSDKTIGALIAAGAAPEYTAMMARLKDRSKKP